ncbi:MAG: D-alanine--D-alanine ligase [Bacteroidales bacterium]|jgi:D-alanine-D-alanine ligase|nr:D-alanine--D-alanine ligase [Bacteroidales bacterium]
MKKNIAVITGGNSGEYEISLKSGQNIIKNLNANLYSVFPIHLRYGDWTYTHPDSTIYTVDRNDFTITIDGNKVFFDCVFIAIHGDPGENGKLQSYFEMLNIPYVGSNSAVSLLTFHKEFCNRVVSSHGIKTATSVSLFKEEAIDEEKILSIVGLPCFVKPCNSGSSVGMSKVKRKEELADALQKAFKHDNQLLIEQFIEGREITCGVMKIKNKIEALAVTEIVSKREYFDLEAKYDPNLADEITPAPIPSHIETLCMKTSEKIYQFLGCKGITRSDYIYNETGLYFIEINTIPGQTNESIIPKQLRYLGLDFSQLCTSFIEEAISENKKATNDLG